MRLSGAKAIQVAAATTLLLATHVAVASLVDGVRRKSWVHATPAAGADFACGTDLSASTARAMLATSDAGGYVPLEGVAGASIVGVAFHVVRTSDGTCGADIELIPQALDRANELFAPAGIEFVQFGCVDYIDDTSMFSGISSDAKVYQLWSMNVVDGAINIYLIPQFEGNLAQLRGKSSFPDDPVQGIVLINNTLNESDPSTMAHELGHYFSLLHTHETMNGVECPDESNCITAGDGICDTPADPNLHGNVTDDCQYTGPQSTIWCPFSGEYSPDTQNVMSYSLLHCKTHFSAGQISRIAATLQRQRHELILADLPAVCDQRPAIGSLVASASMYIPGQALALEANGVIAPPGTSITSVRFECYDFCEGNALCGGWELGVDASPAGGWTWSGVVPDGWHDGTWILRARAQCSNGQCSDVVCVEVNSGFDAYVKASNTGSGDAFASSVAISGDTIVIGCWGEDSSATTINGDQANDAAPDAGAAYVFVRSGSTWTQQAYLKAANAAAGDRFGTSVAISGDTIIVGAPREDVGGSDAGSAYVFVRSGTTWSQQAYLKASNAGAGDRFGVSVAVSDNTAVVGANREDSAAVGVGGDQSSNAAADAGAAYIFIRSGGTWTQQAYLKASNSESLDYFGFSVAINGDLVAVGAPYEDGGATGVDGDSASNSHIDSGAAYLFGRQGGVWSQQAYLKASNTDGSDAFGISVAVSGTTLVVGADAEDSVASRSGAAYVFHRDGIWSQQAFLKASPPGADDHFGGSVSISGDRILVGARYADGPNADAGLAYAFLRSSAVWSDSGVIRAPNPGPGDNFGGAVAVEADRVLAGAPSEDSNATGVGGDSLNNGAIDSGAAFVFTFAPAPTGDMNGDGHVSGADLAMLLGAWGTVGENGLDLDGSGVVDGADLAILLGAWTG